MREYATGIVNRKKSHNIIIFKMKNKFKHIPFTIYVCVCALKCKYAVYRVILLYGLQRKKFSP